ncbi:MAG: helix-turn-helix domain-containing protein [Saccharolobus sp.]
MNLRDKILVYLYQNNGSTVDEIAEALREDKYEVDATLKYLEKDGYINKRVKGLIFKKTIYDLTASGLDKAKKIYEEVQNKAEDVKRMILNNQITPSQLPEEYMDLLSLFIALSLIDTILLEDLAIFDSQY